MNDWTRQEAFTERRYTNPNEDAYIDELRAIRKEAQQPLVTYPEYRADMLKVLCLKAYVYVVGVALVGGLALSVVLALQIGA